MVLTALLIPAGMGYARAAGLPPETGLYATIVPLLVYAVVGPSRILVLGPDSSLVPLIAVSVLPLAEGDPGRAVALAGLSAVLVGVILIAGSLVQLGIVTDLLSRPIRVGYLVGIGAVIIVSQIAPLLGFSAEGDTLVEELGDTVGQLAEGAAVGPAAAFGLGSLVTLVVLRRWAPRVPAPLVPVVVSMLVVGVAGAPDGVDLVGRLPQGLPAPALGGLGWDDVWSLLGPSAAIALIAFADTGILARVFAARRGDRLDGDQEMGAVGAANLAAGLFGGFPVSASSTRTPVVEQAGAHTQLASVVGAVLIGVFVVVVPGVTEWLPEATLAAVVIVAGAALVDLEGLAGLFRMSRTDFALAVVSFTAVAVLGPLPGIGLAVGLSLVVFIRRAWRPHTAELVRVEWRKGYHDRARHPQGRRIPGLVIARFDAPLFFANGAAFAGFVRELVSASPAPVRWVVVAAEPITGLDTTAAEELVELDDHLAGRGVRLVFAEMKGPVKDRIRRYGLGDRFGPDRFFPTVGTAVAAYVEDTGTPWVDWEDRPPGTTGDGAPGAR